ncbi:MAG: LruC domain-containing protein [Polyangiaceae bacterium]|nr:LruC domain-containing protein [Polyangiaceae bacterium]
MFLDLTAGEVVNVSARAFRATSTLYSAPLFITMTDPTGSAEQHELTLLAGRFGDEVSVTPTSVGAPLQISVPEDGVYRFSFSEFVAPWDISVTAVPSPSVDPMNPEGGRGRLYATQWSFNAGTFASSGATDSDFYVVTPAGTEGSNYVWLLDFEGLAGYVYDVAGNSLGLPPPYSRTSQEAAVEGLGYGAFVPEHDVYLNLPVTALGPSATPVVTFDGVSGSGMTLEGAGGQFRFQSNVAGTYQVVIDTDRNGAFDPTTSDAVVAGSCKIGNNDAVWDGVDGFGASVPSSNVPYNARLYLRIGEFHFAGWDIETAKPGLSIVGVDPQTDAQWSTQMFWDDRAILTGDPNDDPAPPETVLDGVASGSTRHEWGNFHGAGPGNVAYVDTWVFGTESSDDHALEVHAAAADADGDGVTNAADSFPCDPALSSTLFVPAEGVSAAVFFEDLWPSPGDLDFNDLVLAYNYAFGLDSQGEVRVITVNLTPRAAGAGYHSGIGLVLPINSTLISNVTRLLGGEDAASHSWEAEGSGTLIRVLDDTRDLFLVEGQVILNTDPTKPVVNVNSVALRIELSSPVILSTEDVPFDLFTFRSTDVGHEIHLPKYHGTSYMNTGLFGTGIDGSIEGWWFVDRTGLPFALSVPAVSLYPLERLQIDELFPNIIGFAASAGTANTDYYSEGVVSENGFVAGSFGGAPPPPELLPISVVIGGTECGS